MFAYGFDKLKILKSYGDSNLTEYIEDQFNSNAVNVDYETSNFNLALKLFVKDESIDLTRLLTLDVDLARNGSEDTVELGTHQCNVTDFNLYYISNP